MALQSAEEIADQLQDSARAASRGAFNTVALTAIVAAAVLSWDRPGIGWPLTALVGVGAVWAALRGGRPRSMDSGRAVVRAAWGVAACLLLAVGAVRAAGWLFVLCVVTAGLVGCVALTGRWSIGGTLLAPPRVAGWIPAALRWLVRGGVPAPGRSRTTFVRTFVAVLIGVGQLMLFGYLLVWADPLFARMLTDVLPSPDLGTLARWAGSAALAITVVATTAYVLLTGATMAEPEFRRVRVRRVEWALPVGGLVALFAAFVAVQATVLFGGREYVETTAGLTYAEYARGGFWQLLAVTGLTLVVVGVAARIAPRSATIDRVLLRTLLGLLSALTLVIVASALSRMAAYEQAYGFTRPRLLVMACELWLGVVFLLILAAGIRLRGRWVPPAALGAAVAALLGLAVLNPDEFIARQNIARYDEIRRIDVDYLKTLSPDAVPALLSLPDPYRSCALAAVNRELSGDRPDAWYEWNLGRSRARARLRAHPPATPVPCPR